MGYQLRTEKKEVEEKTEVELEVGRGGSRVTGVCNGAKPPCQWGGLPMLGKLAVHVADVSAKQPSNARIPGETLQF